MGPWLQWDGCFLLIAVHTSDCETLGSVPKLFSSSQGRVDETLIVVQTSFLFFFSSFFEESRADW